MAIIKNLYFSALMFGEVLEWLKRHAWKACVRQKRTEGSNPSLSALIFLLFLTIIQKSNI